MNVQWVRGYVPARSLRQLRHAAMVLLAIALVACAAPHRDAADVTALQSKLNELQSDPQLAAQAPAELQEAEEAVRAAEQPRRDEALTRHLVLVADHKLEIARARAQERTLEDERDDLAERRERARMAAREREVEIQRYRADIAEERADAQAAEADQAEAERRWIEARARDEQRSVQALSAQLDEMQTRQTERGLTLTLSDMVFAIGEGDLQPGATDNLDRLAAFLNDNPDRSVVIEGHTDSLGPAEENRRLSEQRAEAVKVYLVGRGVEASRISTVGRGEEVPIASNDTAAGRQQNRRVEVIIADRTSAR